MTDTYGPIRVNVCFRKFQIKKSNKLKSKNVDS